MPEGEGGAGAAAPGRRPLEAAPRTDAGGPAPAGGVGGILGDEPREPDARTTARAGVPTAAAKGTGAPRRGLPGTRPAGTVRAQAGASYLLILSTNARRSALGSVAMARPRPVGLQGRGVRAAGTRGAAEPVQRAPRGTPASSGSAGSELPRFHLRRRIARGRAQPRRGGERGARRASRGGRRGAALRALPRAPTAGRRSAGGAPGPLSAAGNAVRPAPRSCRGPWARAGAPRPPPGDLAGSGNPPGSSPLGLLEVAPGPGNADLRQTKTTAKGLGGRFRVQINFCKRYAHRASWGA